MEETAKEICRLCWLFSPTRLLLHFLQENLTEIKNEHGVEDPDINITKAREEKDTKDSICFACSCFSIRIAATMIKP